MMSLDAMAFPLVALPDVGLEVMLLPVTRTQFDFFLGDRTGFPSAALQDMERVAPRRSWRTQSPDRLEGLFLSAIQADEAEAFARWYGRGFRTPSDTEWRAVDHSIGAVRHRLRPLEDALGENRLHPAARSILTLTMARNHATMRSAGLFEHGLLEWVRRPGGGHGLQGRPRPELLRVVHNPQTHEAIIPRTTERHPAFGVRLVRPLTPRVA
jgi:hypothetical protein